MHGDLESYNGYVCAKTENTQVYTAHQGRRICVTRFAFSGDQGGGSLQWGYDDESLFTLNDRVMFASHPSLAGVLPADNAGLVYDWPSLQNLEMSFSNGSNTCVC